ncbi:MAG TPA: hypothetical protein VK899_10640, partial [Gemmatimonadales bacterium]|nr:hypothetical protein [Gemmatimonadales bacterium]
NPALQAYGRGDLERYRRPMVGARALDPIMGKRWYRGHREAPPDATVARCVTPLDPQGGADNDD